jgi:hypothetical protein
MICAIRQANSGGCIVQFFKVDISFVQRSSLGTATTF